MQPQKRNAVYNTLYQRIVTGKYPCGSKLPGELKLIREFGVCRETLRGAMALLEANRLLRRAPGYGTHVRYCGSGNPPRLLYVSKDAKLPGELLTTYLDSAGYSVLVCSREQFLAGTEEELEAYLAENKVTCIAYRGSFFFFSDEALLRLQRVALPSLLFLADRESLLKNCMAGISYKLKSAWAEALGILVRKGYRRVGIIAPGNGKGQCRGFDRSGFETYCREIGLVFSLEYLLNRISAPEQEIAENGGYSAAVASEVERMLALPQRPAAFLCHNDQWAVTVYEVLKRHKLRIPEDVAVMGFTGNIPAEHFSPKLATFRFDEESQYGNLVRLLRTAPQWNRRGAERPVYEAKLIFRPGESI